MNYLAGFALTHLLWPQLATAPSARVVSVSSAGQAPIDFDDVMLERSYNGIQAYCQSKLAQFMMTFDLAGGGDGDPSVVATALHPSTYLPGAYFRLVRPSEGAWPWNRAWRTTTMAMSSPGIPC